MKLVSYLILCTFLFACKSGPFNLLKPASPHEQYERKLINAGLNQSSMGKRWIENATNLLQNAKLVKIPYQETGYFAADKIEGAGFKFRLERGQLLSANLTTQAINGFAIYMDILEQRENGEFKKLAFSDSAGTNLQWEANRSGEYFLRLQPELLSSGSYTLQMNIGPSLAYPLKAVNRKQIQSFFGVGRDNNTRRHEGIDIFAGFRTPVLAVAEGTVTRVNENNLGGKVVWFRPKGKDYTLYYAHLDEQLATSGQEVVIGDTLGLMGNTGNAKTTPPHLHFGIYANEGAVNPLPYIDPLVPEIPKITADISKLNTTMNTQSTLKLSLTDEPDGVQILDKNTVVRVLAASGNNFKVELPNGKIGYLPNKSLKETKVITKRKAGANLKVLDFPAEAAGVKTSIATGDQMSVLGYFDGFQLIQTEDNIVGWVLLK